MKTTKCILALLISLSISTGLRAQVLDVKEVFQEMDQWCWAGVSDCFLDYYGCPYPQCEIVEYTRIVSDPGVFGYVNVCMDRSGANNGKYMNGSPGTIEDILLHFADIVLLANEGPLELSRISQEFSARRPIIIRWAWDGGGAHYILGHGLVGQDVHYMNPWPGEGKKIGEYDWMKQGSGHSWSVTGSTLTSPTTDKPPKPEGDTLIFVDSGNSSYSTSGVKYASSYDWNLLPAEAGTASGNDTLCTIDWSDTFTGTAQLTVNGRNKSGEGNVSDILSITVLPTETDPTLGDLSIDYESIEGFASNIFDYYIETTSSSMPVIEAIPKNPDAVATITPPTTIPGRAVIEVTSTDQLRQSIYTIHFAIDKGETWSWATGANGREYSKGNALTVDNDGNTIAAGFYNSFSLSLGSQTLYNSGGGDVFVVRYNSKGGVDWALSSSDDGFESATGISSDPSGNVYVIGDFQGEFISFGSDTLRNTGPIGSSDIFILKIDPSGKVVWMNLIGSGFVEQGTSITSDKDGNVYATGMFTGRTMNLGAHMLTGTGGADLFVCKLNSSGDFEWASSATGDGDEIGNSIAADIHGNIVVSGTFNGSSVSFGSTVLSNDGYSNIMVAKFDPSGNAIWAKHASGDGEDDSHGISTDNEGSIYVSGAFSSSRINFGDISVDNSGDTDVFLAKYSSSGEEVWVRAAVGQGRDYSTGVTLDVKNNPCITGSYESFPFHFGEKYLPNQGKRDIFISKFDPQGSLVWTKWAGGCSDDEASGITSDNEGNIYLTGMSTSPAISFGLNTLENEGCGLMFIAKLNSLSLSIDHIFTKSSLVIYPNPTLGEFTVQCPEDTYEIKIFDSKGSLIRLIRPEGKTSLSAFLEDRGLFYVQARSALGVSTQKLIIIPGL